MAQEIPNLAPLDNVQSSSQSVRLNKAVTGIIIVAVVALGVFSGYWLVGRGGSKTGTSKNNLIVAPSGKIDKGSEFGINDTASFKDTAMGVLEKGGLDDEGTHKLIREGGPSQTVYLTSSILDLDQFAGRKIQIWGATLQARKAGWLMDVGKIKILE